ncbi:MAG: hypothetical protein ACI30I_06445, partial [Parabacteroides sp.]
MKNSILIRKLTWTLSLLFILGSWNMVWGQWPNTINQSSAKKYTLQNPNSEIKGNAIHIIYAQVNEPKSIMFQEYNAENLDGFIHWYLEEDQSNATVNWQQRPSNGYTFANGLAWMRNEDGVPPENACSVNFSATNTGVYRLICEASASNRSSVSGNTITVPPISVKAVYEIHVINSARLTNSSPFSGNDLSAPALENPDNYFIEYFEVHTPNNGTTNFRLNELLSNYYIPNRTSIVPPTQVRWRQYTENGVLFNTVVTPNSNITSFTFSESVKKQI